MAKIEPSPIIEGIHGKTDKKAKGYHTNRHGKQFYIEREEGYQKNQSPRQKWNSAAFAYAHQQLRLIESDPDTLAQMNADWEVAKHIGQNGRLMQTAHGWKFNMLIAEYKTANPLQLEKQV